MYICDLTRDDLVSLLPRGGEVAEIGVEGAFSQAILNRPAPRRLHLIDPWEHQERDDYQGDLYGNASGGEQDARYRSVVGAFDAQALTGQVVVHRGYSIAAAESFSDGQLDWIYVDALQSREAVNADLHAYSVKVEPDGFILGHDYTNHLPARTAGFGVVEAVNDFVAETDWYLLAITMKNFPTYILARDHGSEATEQLRLRLLHAAPRVVEIKNFPSAGRFEHHALEIGGRSVVDQSY